MSLTVGQVLQGHAASYLITKILKEPKVFQAMVVPRNAIFPPYKLVVIKHEPPGRNRVEYNRERRCYGVESIAQSPYIRRMHESIGHAQNEEGEDAQPQYMVFEWMDSDLWQQPSEPFRSGSQVPRIVAKAVLEALAVFADVDGVHTDVNPNNVLVSGIHDPSPTVKLGDLGNLIGAGETKSRYQLAHWLASKPIFGPTGKIIQDMTEAWCLAKMIRLAGALEAPIKPEYGEEFATAEFLERETFIHPATGVEEKFIKLGTIRQELEAVPGHKIDVSCIDFIESLLVVDHAKRPTAREALKHPWLHDLD